MEEGQVLEGKSENVRIFGSVGIRLAYENKSEQEDISRDKKLLECLSIIEECILKGEAIQKPKGGWPLEITMPCGEKTVFKNLSEFPTETLMCRCGNPNCVVVEIDF